MPPLRSAQLNFSLFLSPLSCSVLFFASLPRERERAQPYSSLLFYRVRYILPLSLPLILRGLCFSRFLYSRARARARACARSFPFRYSLSLSSLVLFALFPRISALLANAGAKRESVCIRILYALSHCIFLSRTRVFQLSPCCAPALVVITRLLLLFFASARRRLLSSAFFRALSLLLFFPFSRAQSFILYLSLSLSLSFSLVSACVRYFSLCISLFIILFLLLVLSSRAYLALSFFKSAFQPRTREISLSLSLCSRGFLIEISASHNSRIDISFSWLVKYDCVPSNYRL